MRVALVGLGDIARKAYLPVLTAVPGIELHLVTRNADQLSRLGDKYRLANRHLDLPSAISAGLEAAFVHVATDAHAELVSALLESGVHVYVDKPLTSSLEACERLVRLAETTGRSLMVGFNRRFAPCYADLAERPRDLIMMQKNRRRLPGDVRKVVFDDFIHVVDTLRALAPGPIREVSTDAKVREGDLHHVALTLRGEGFVAFGTMNRMSGSDEESLEVMGSGFKRRVENMATIMDYDCNTHVSRRPDWEPATSVRGFDRICARFLAAVERGERLCARDALETHALCEAIVARIEREGRDPGPAQ